MYELQVTEGIVLGKRGIGEANTLVFALTQNLGVVRASARSTRLGASKLRYGIEPLTCARYSFIKGRHEWRLVQVDAPRALFAHASPAQRAAAGRVCQLLLRLIHGQESAAGLYADVRDGFALMASASAPDAIEVVLVLRILAHLGYLPHTEALAPFVGGEFSIDLSAQALQSRSLLVRTINEALQATGL